MAQTVAHPTKLEDTTDPRGRPGVIVDSSLRYRYACARRAGRFGAVRDGDIIHIDVAARRIDLQLDDAGLADRLRAWTPPPQRYTTGVMAKYARLMSSAAEGAVTS